jgi:hypothetical protein
MVNNSFEYQIVKERCFFDTSKVSRGGGEATLIQRIFNIRKNKHTGGVSQPNHGSTNEKSARNSTQGR